MQVGPDVVGNLAEDIVFIVARIRGSAADDEPRLVHGGGLGQVVVVDESRVGVHPIRQRLKVHRCRRDRLDTSVREPGVVAVCEVASVGEVETHDAVVWLEEPSEDCHVGGRSRQRLHVDPPLIRREPERFERAVLAQLLDLVDVNVSTVIPRPNFALGVLVGEAGAHHLHHGPRSEIFRSDQFETGPLPLLLQLKNIKQLGVMIG
mmetsp:Transcript_15531/g.40247  ORF Transcript_15531/g.40247 Transcript_15531/m.40247 type:complete len:206 (+) Transcript_15531:776-1393(+)